MTPVRVSGSIHRRITLFLQVVLLLGLVLSAFQRQWMVAISVERTALSGRAQLGRGADRSTSHPKRPDRKEPAKMPILA